MLRKTGFTGENTFLPPHNSHAHESRQNCPHNLQQSFSQRVAEKIQQMPRLNAA